jgi:hypothetical protein
MNAIAKLVNGFARLPFWKEWWLKARQARREGAFSRAKRKGMSNADARAYSDRLYPPTAENIAYEKKGRQGMKKSVTDEDRVIIGLNAAAYMRWVETRKGASPPAQAIQGFIKGFLDADGFAYAADEPKRIEILALAFDAETVQAFIKENGFFETLDHHQIKRE